MAVLLLSLVALGCGGGGAKTYPVRGKVTYKGKAVPNGTVSFVSSSGQAATGDIQSDGSYQLTTFRRNDGAVAGEHKVVIVAMQDMGNRLPEERSPTPPPIVPVKYTSLTTTPLKAQVKTESNTIDFELKD